MKKRFIYVFFGFVLVIAVLALLVFAFSGDNNTPEKDVDVTGTWKVVTYVNSGSATLVENEFMIFSDSQATVYRDGNKEPYASSSFTITPLMQMELPEVSKTYTVDCRSEEHIRLYENKDSYMCLIRYPNEDMSNVEIDTSIIVGKWDVVYRDSDKDFSDEYLIFENGKMYDFHGDAEEPTVSMEYVWNENQIEISVINKTMILNIISDTEVAFIETDTGYIWELKKSDYTD